MEFGFGSYGFGFLAGLLSTLSPCVLPIIPILLGALPWPASAALGTGSVGIQAVPLPAARCTLARPGWSPRYSLPFNCLETGS